MASYEETRFWTTHNSYTGGADLGSLVDQLNKKVRWLELDIHDDEYDRVGDYRLGHWNPGSEVMVGDGNPASLLLRDWLAVLAAWSATPANARHAPVTLVLDIKSDLTDNDEGGDLEDLNQRLEDAFGAKLFTRADYDGRGAWPELDDLRGRFLVVLSGDGGTRIAYRAAYGGPPAMAVNTGGDVVLAYRSPGGDMRCWSGQATAGSDRVVWYRKGTYAVNPYTVSEPTLAINDDRWVASVYRVGPQPGQPGPALLESRLGRMQDDAGGVVNRRIKWFRSPQQLDAGRNPSLQIDGDEVRLVHETADGQGRREVRGTINRQKQTIAWRKGRDSALPLFPRDRAEWQGRPMQALVNLAGRVIFRLDAQQTAVGFRQVAFVERQKGDDTAQIGDALFFAADAGSPNDIAEARNARLPSRAWWFKEPNRTDPPSPPQENAAATDTPFTQWYEAYMNGGQVAW